MYCKHCGKEIADDSKYCQHCGGAQGQESKSNFNGLFASFAKQKKMWLIYLIWVLINYLMYLLGNIEHASTFPEDVFFPFPKKVLCYKDYNWFDIDSYDFSEFIVYSFILPLVICLLFLYKDKIKKLFKKK